MGETPIPPLKAVLAKEVCVMDGVRGQRGGLGRVGVGLVVFAFVLGAVLRLYDLGGLSLWHDELVASHPVTASLHNFAEILGRTALRDVHPPLYYCINILGLTVYGVSEFTLRLPPAVFGLATLPLVYLLGVELHSRRVGVWAMLLTAALPYHVYHSRQARMYSLLALLAVGSTLIFLRLARGAGGRWAWPAWLVVTCMMTTTHLYGMFVLGAQACLVASRGRRAGRALVSWACVFTLPTACYLPFLLFAKHLLQDRGGNSMFAFDGSIYTDTLSFLFGSHPRLHVAWVLPVAALAIFGMVRRPPSEAPGSGSRQPRGEAEPRGLAAPPPVSSRARWAWLGCAGLAAITAAGVTAASGKIDAAMKAFGENVTPSQARTFILDLTIGSVGMAVACAAVALRDRAASAVPPGWLGPQEDELPEVPAFSLSLVAGLMLALPFAVALLAGLAGQAIALPRSFIATAPFAMLLVAQGLAALGAWAQAAVGALAMVCFIAICGRFGAVPGLRPDEVTLRAWLVHEHYDWSPLRTILPHEDHLPVVALRIAVTDGIIYYGQGHEVARVKLSAPVAMGDPGKAPQTPPDGALVFAQVRGGDGPHVFRAGEPFPDARVGELYWVDAPLPESYAQTPWPAARDRLRQEMEKGYACREIGAVPVDSIHVYRCTARRAAAP